MKYFNYFASWGISAFKIDICCGFWDNNYLWNKNVKNWPFSIRGIGSHTCVRFTKNRHCEKDLNDCEGNEELLHEFLRINWCSLKQLIPYSMKNADFSESIKNEN